ncbi:hypothetical protein HON36_04365 [Candidatus Parcubacteria bacterium]|jgi:hypothetical protein|nr:hypothetical protein [Candidatus Parcubacteria bacterium]MBT7228484.1 hypothetical protein [Candidatus Parcubacteria bacterium]
MTKVEVCEKIRIDFGVLKDEMQAIHNMIASRDMAILDDLVEALKQARNNIDNFYVRPATLSLLEKAEKKLSNLKTNQEEFHVLFKILSSDVRKFEDMVFEQKIRKIPYFKTMKLDD